MNVIFLSSIMMAGASFAMEFSLDFLDDTSSLSDQVQKNVALENFGNNADAEFSALPKVANSSFFWEAVEDFLATTNLLNAHKNRYQNLFTRDCTRVKLVDSDSDYINANWINLSDDNGVSYPRHIATQAPPPLAMEDFWSMIWQENISVVVMLTSLGFQKAERYWPEDMNGAMVFGKYQIVAKEVKTIESLTITSLLLKKHNETRVVYHFHYKEWPDHGVPENTAAMRELINLVDRGLIHSKSTSTVVHCSAGVGRTGTFIGAFHAIKIIENTGVVPDIAELVKKMRESRAQMVQSASQYNFIYSTIKDRFLDQP